jgi:hypothetical protein
MKYKSSVNESEIEKYHLLGFNAIPIISQQTFLGSLFTDAYAGICLMICLTDSNVLFLIVILVFKV